jgi:hypothetical protein
LFLFLPPTGGRIIFGETLHCFCFWRDIIGMGVDMIGFNKEMMLVA